MTTTENEETRASEGEKELRTAVSSRFVDAYAGTHGIVCAESYCSNVQTIGLILAMDIGFVGVVKNATVKYPKEICLSEPSVSPWCTRTVQVGPSNGLTDRCYVISTKSTKLDRYLSDMHWCCCVGKCGLSTRKDAAECQNLFSLFFLSCGLEAGL